MSWLKWRSDFVGYRGEEVKNRREQSQYGEESQHFELLIWLHWQRMSCSHSLGFFSLTSYSSSRSFCCFCEHCIHWRAGRDSRTAKAPHLGKRKDVSSVDQWCVIVRIHVCVKRQCVSVCSWERLWENFSRWLGFSERVLAWWLVCDWNATRVWLSIIKISGSARWLIYRGLLSEWMSYLYILYVYTFYFLS